LKLQKEKEDNFLSDTNEMIEISKRDSYIQKYGIDPVFTPVYLSYNAYKRIVGYAMRYGRNDLPQKAWREVYGILIGSIKENKEVIVKDAIPVMVGDRAYVEYKTLCRYSSV